MSNQNNEIKHEKISSDKDFKRAVALDIAVSIRDKNSDKEKYTGKILSFDENNVITQKDSFSRSEHIISTELRS